MLQKFSQELIDRLINYFLSVRGTNISSEQANEYLNSMADLYLEMSKK
jgi:hypothetical protein